MPRMTADHPDYRPPSGIPAGGRDPEPYVKGNTAALGHGAYVTRIYLPLAQELAAGLVEAHPDLARYPVAVARWAEWEARAMLMRRHLAQHGDLDGDGPTAEPRKNATNWLRQCERSAEKAAAVLGLDPLNEARLSRERAAASVLMSGHGLADLADRGREALAAREAAGIPPPRDLAGEHLARVAEEGKAAQERANAERAAATEETR
jgi:hypothetical protein